jgi:hypothetical protein
MRPKHRVGSGARSSYDRGVRRLLALLVLLAAGLSACGGAGAGGPGGTAGTAPPPARPALARTPARPGEVLVRGDASPRSHGPFTLRGRYTVRFEQIAPEDPELDFSTQTAFVVSLDRRAQVEDRASVRLFRAAARTGRREVSLHGRYYLDVTFGDFPYAIRFTPVARG